MKHGLSVAAQLGWACEPLSAQAGMWTDWIAQAASAAVFECSRPVVSRRCCGAYSWPLALWSFCPLFCYETPALGQGYGRDVPFVIEHSIDTYFVHFDQL